MNDRSDQDGPASVPSGAKQAGAVRARWAWTEEAVWSERMLAALEAGVKGGKWFSLIDKVTAPRTLAAAWAKVRANDGAPGVDHQTVEMFERREAANLAELARRVQAGHYQPSPVRRTWIDKPGSRQQRPLGIPTVRDRVLQTALRQALEPIFERDFAEQSYGFRPGRGCRQALRRVDALLRAGLTWVVDADLKSYFDTIPHAGLLALVRQKVADGAVLELIEAYLKQGVLESMREWTPERGTPQGAVISPLLSNIYLDPLDHRMAQAGVAMVRYADDLVLLCAGQAEAEAALGLLRAWTGQAGLELHPEKTRLVDATQPGGFDFLGYHFERGLRWPRKKSEQKLKENIRRITRRNNGHSLAEIIADLNPRLRGWYGYFKHSVKWTFERLDRWIRMRLRSILRQRRGGRGRGRGSDHQRWPNAYFASRGLFSMTAARELDVQSAQAANH